MGPWSIFYTKNVRRARWRKNCAGYLYWITGRSGPPLHIGFTGVVQAAAEVLQIGLVDFILEFEALDVTDAIALFQIPLYCDVPPAVPR